jgi:hypothetical protein
LNFKSPNPESRSGGVDSLAIFVGLSRNDSVGRKGIAGRILSQDEARARRGTMESPRLRPELSKQRSSCGRKRNQGDRSH